MSEINKFLDAMDQTRETRYESEQTSELRQYFGFRKDWADYLEDNLDNLYNS